MPDGTAVFSSGDVLDNLFLFDDLFELPAHEKSPTGLEGKRVRWSEGWRALDPSVSPDGRRVVFTTNHRGTQYLMMADVVTRPDGGGGHALANVRPLVRSAPFDQAYTPRWSPDGRHVAYSSWSRGGYRDMRIVDTDDGSYIEVTHDRAIDGDPVVLGGRALALLSLGPQRRHQRLRLRGGDRAAEAGHQRRQRRVPARAIARRQVARLRGLHARGIRRLRHASRRVAVARPAAVRGDAPGAAARSRPRRPSRRAPTTPAHAPAARLLGEDHARQLRPGQHRDGGGERHRRHPLVLGEHDDRVGAPRSRDQHRVHVRRGCPSTWARACSGRSRRRTNYALGGEHACSGSSRRSARRRASSYAMPRAFDSQSFDLSYSIASVSGQLPLPASELNPYDMPSIPSRGMLGTLHLGWGYSNAEGYLWSVGNEKGFDASADVRRRRPGRSPATSPATRRRSNFATYLPMPWLRTTCWRSTSAAAWAAATAAGKGPYYMGGFIDLPVVNVVQNSLIQGGIQLRGYPVVAEAGNYYALFNAEYRFPIVNVDRGPSTLPVFLNRISGAAFVDCGSAFNDPKSARFKTGVGGELWFDMTLGYMLGFTFRAGLRARGSRAAESTRRTSSPRCLSDRPKLARRRRGVIALGACDRRSFSALSVPLLALLAGCPAPTTGLAQAQQTAQDFNLDARFGRNELVLDQSRRRGARGVRAPPSRLGDGDPGGRRRDRPGCKPHGDHGRRHRRPRRRGTAPSSKSCEAPRSSRAGARKIAAGSSSARSASTETSGSSARPSSSRRPPRRKRRRAVSPPSASSGDDPTAD